MLQTSLENSASALNHTTTAQEQVYAQLRLGFSSGEPTPWPTGGGGGLSPLSDSLPMRPRSSQGVLHSTALVVDTQFSTFGPGQGPALTTLTEQEKQGVLKATSLDIDAITLAGMEKMLNDTENAEMKTTRIIFETLGRSSDESRNQKDHRFQNQRRQLSSSAALAKCGPNVMGQWAETRKRVFRLGELRYEVQFETPVIFVCPPSNLKGPVTDTQVWHIDGTDTSLAATRTRPPWVKEWGRTTAEANLHIGDNEQATWVVLLQELQRMEHDSWNWELTQYASNPPRDAISRFENHTLCAAVQAKKRTWDTMPDQMKKPYATTTMCHLIEMAAMLGIYWQEFDRSADKYRAEGNGYVLTGAHVADFGIVFTFQISSQSRFEDNRITPADEVKELAFGLVSTIFRYGPDKRRLVFPTEEPTDLTILKMGSANEFADTLVSFGCNTNTSNYIRSSTKQHGHLFPCMS